jgi:hypothetical protein
MGMDFETKPLNFILCFNKKCLLRKKCLRHIVSLSNKEEKDLLLVVNASKFNQTNCKYYFENKKVGIAYGMKGSFEDVKAKDIAKIRKELIRHFGQTYYYERRNGKMPITPNEQVFIENLFKQYGYEIKFDKIETKTLWK